ncbi:MAG: acyltransferase family protein [Elainellaceae cyanobacterium]
MKNQICAETDSARQRAVWIDFAKSYGMFLVFFGHILEAFGLADSVALFMSYKFIYAFHIPFFFLLSGYLAKSPRKPFSQYFRTKLFTRLIVPFLFFNIIALLLFFSKDTLVFFSKDVLVGTHDFLEHLRQALRLIKGNPAFNITTWFLACLFSVRLIDFVVSKYIKSSYVRLLIASFLFVAGWLLTLNFRNLVLDFWLLPEALVAYLFYTLGATLNHQSWLFPESGRKNFLGFCLSLGITLATFNLNHSLVASDAYYTVNMGLSQHGQPLLFLITALSGSLAVMYLARWSAASGVLRKLQIRLGIKFVGVNTLTFLGLNGLLMVANHAVVKPLVALLPHESALLLAVSIVLTILSLLLCIPATLFLKRYLPQCIGLPKVSSQN